MLLAYKSTIPIVEDVITIEKESLVSGIKNRDEDSYQELFQTYAKLLWVVASGILSSCDGAVQDIEECVSDAFIELWNHPGKYDPARGSLKSYLCRITKNKAIDTWRRKSKEHIISLDDYAVVQSAEIPSEDDFFDIKDYSVLYNSIRELQEPMREIIVRHYFHNEKPAQIAKRLGLPQKEIENRLYRGKRKLQKALSGLGEINK